MISARIEKAVLKNPGYSDLPIPRNPAVSPEDGACANAGRDKRLVSGQSGKP